MLDYLRAPLERIQTYQNFIKELIKFTAKAEKDTKMLQKASELMLAVPQRADDLAFTRNIQQYPGDILKLGRLLRHVRIFTQKFLPKNFKLLEISGPLSQKEIFEKLKFFQLKIEIPETCFTEIKIRKSKFRKFAAAKI